MTFSMAIDNEPAVMAEEHQRHLRHPRAPTDRSVVLGSAYADILEPSTNIDSNAESIHVDYALTMSYTAS